jgi:hypothetical protein
MTEYSIKDLRNGPEIWTGGLSEIFDLETTFITQPRVGLAHLCIPQPSIITAVLHGEKRFPQTGMVRMVHSSPKMTLSKVLGA